MQDEFNIWKQGYGVIKHSKQTINRVNELITSLDSNGSCDKNEAVELFRSADLLCNMAMRLTVQMSYVNKIDLAGSDHVIEDFKENPQGHLGGSLNMVPAYIGYMLANALTNNTRSWIMGQGHCVAAIDAVNVLLGNLEHEQAERYHLNNQGLSTLCQDFYGYQINKYGRPLAPLGSHVNAYTGGGISEGGYLGFAELQYMHMPLPGQELVTFLSDGAFEEQRGSDWAPRWWRGEDTGLILPIMIANGRRIDQRSSMVLSGGVKWFEKHLTLNNFLPLPIDGKDPAAFAWAIITMAKKLKSQHNCIKNGKGQYPVKIPYAIAETIKGFGFIGAGTNHAHNLPLIGNPIEQKHVRTAFNQSLKKLFVPFDQLTRAIKVFKNHQKSSRPQEFKHGLRVFEVKAPLFPDYQEQMLKTNISSMVLLDIWFADFIHLNKRHRFKVGNPDEMRSNRMNKTLDKLSHRVSSPEHGVAESIAGGVITALNEEAVVSAALANKQGINLVVSYEAFAVKMLGAMRQEMTFSRNLQLTGRPANWISVPLIVTSHTWENSKNEHSHQDPTLCEAWLSEMADAAPVIFPFDAHTAIESLIHVYQQSGSIAVLVIAKNNLPIICTKNQAKKAVKNGVYVLSHDKKAIVQIIALGAYQLQEVMKAAERLRKNGYACSVIALLEPAKFRQARDKKEAAYVHQNIDIENLIPAVKNRVVVCHTHTDVITGVLRKLDTGAKTTRFMGYQNQGGTFDLSGMQKANQQTWAHIIKVAAEIIGVKNLNALVTQKELDSNLL